MQGCTLSMLAFTTPRFITLRGQVNSFGFRGWQNAWEPMHDIPTRLQLHQRVDACPLLFLRDTEVILTASKTAQEGPEFSILKIPVTNFCGRCIQCPSVDLSRRRPSLLCPRAKLDALIRRIIFAKILIHVVIEREIAFSSRKTGPGIISKLTVAGKGDACNVTSRIS